MYLNAEINDLLEENRHKFIGKNISYRALQMRLNKIFKSKYNIEFKVEEYDDFEPYSVSFSGLYDMFENKIYVILNVSKKGSEIFVGKWKYFKFLLSQTLQHEKIHECQWQYRSCDEPCSKQWRESDKRDMNEERLYLSYKDELDAYGHDIALEVKYFYPKRDPLTVLANINNYKRLTSWNYYKKTFKGTDWLSLKKRLLKKAFIWIRN